MIISIIVPSLNEEGFLEKTLSHTCSLAGNFEIIVVDGGSDDDTLEIVKKFPEVKLFHSKKGRGLQMNCGAKEASGNVLLFLHADTFLPTNTYQLITGLLEDDKIKAGSFYLEFDDNHWAMRFYSRCSKLNIPLFTYGDHGIFIRKKVFEEIHGFKDIPLMEDVEIHRRLKSKGKFQKLTVPVKTSARRFQKNGVLRQFSIDIILVFLYNMGLSPEFLKKFYKDDQ